MFMKFFRKIVLVLAAIVCLATACLVVRELKLPADHQSILSDDAGPVLQKIQSLSSLTTQRAEVADALVTELQGNSGSIKAVLIVQGEITIGVDLSRAKFQSIDQRFRTAVILLPAPTVQSVCLDQERTRIVGIWTNGLWIIVPGGDNADADITNRAYKEAEHMVDRSARDPDLNQQARWQAEQIITAFLRTLGWKCKLEWVG